MTATSGFFDTNVVLYSVTGDPSKAEIAEHLLRQGGTVSVQVLTEFIDVARGKYKTPWPSILDTLTLIQSLCQVHDVTLETHVRGLSISRRYGFRIYDGMILAAATIAGCGTLFSEDMRNGQTVGSVTIRNPFI